MKNMVSGIFKLADHFRENSLEYREYEKGFDEIFRDQMVRKIFARNVKLMCTFRGVTVSKLAKECGYNHTHFTRIVQGKANCSFAVAMAISQYFDLPLKELLTRDLCQECEKLVRKS